MGTAARSHRRRSVIDVLLGIELGVVGSLVGLIWLVVISPVLGHPWWLIPNLLASQFYHSRQVYYGPGVVTVVGIAVQITTFGLVGMLHGVVTPAGRISGLTTALVWYLFCWLYLWKRLAPLMLSSSIQPMVWAAYVLFGSVLGWHKQMRVRGDASLAG